MLIQKDESTAARRRVPCRIFLSNGTAPDTGAVDDAVIVGINSLTTISTSSTLRAINSSQGMYAIELTQSECSILGVHPLYYTLGDFPQHIANIEVVVFQPYSTISAFNPSTTSVGIKTSGVQPGAFDADSIDATALAAMNLSDVTVRVQPMLYSGLTVGINNAAGDVSSQFTVAVSQIKAGSYSGVTLQGLSSIQSADVQQIIGSGPAAIRLGSHLSSVVTGKVIAGVSQTTSFTADVSCTTNDNYNGRVIIFTDPGTSGLYGQATSINSASGYIGFSAGSSLFNVAALTNAPPVNSTFVIV